MSKSTCPESNSVVLPSRDGLVPSSRLASVFSDKQDHKAEGELPFWCALIHWPRPCLLKRGTRDSLGVCTFNKKFPENRITGRQQDYRFEGVNLSLDLFRSGIQTSMSEYDKKIN